ncbi:contact-dependent growth inhibition system immunity protein [Roseivirga pacifica]
MKNYLQYSLDELEGGSWSHSRNDSTTLTTTCINLRKKPLKDFTIEDLRIMVGQEIGLKYLVPISIQHLEVNPLVEGDYYPGDLLSSLLSINTDYWANNPPQVLKLSGIFTNNSALIANEVPQLLSQFQKIIP